jgi:hypothetical protein
LRVAKNFRQFAKPGENGFNLGNLRRGRTRIRNSVSESNNFLRRLSQHNLVGYPKLIGPELSKMAHHATFGNGQQQVSE